jgi:hypothetical protein
MKIIIEDKFEIYSTEFTNMDVSMDQIIESLKGMLLSYGFHINTINEYFKTDEEV